MFYSQVPLFVQIHQKWRRMYVGECQGPGVRTDFEMVHLRKVPNQYTHLSGLLDIFKSKIVSICMCTPDTKNNSITWLLYIHFCLLGIYYVRVRLTLPIPTKSPSRYGHSVSSSIK